MRPRPTSMKRLIPLLLLLAACGSSKAATSSVGAEPPSPSAVASPPTESASDLPSVVAVPTPPSSVAGVVPSRQAPTHAPSPVNPPCCKSTKGSVATVTSSPVSSGPASPPATGPQCTASELSMVVTAAASGSNASFTATLTNKGSQSCTITEGASTPDITVTDGTGATVWTRGCDSSVSGHTGPSPCPMYARLMPLAPGASQTWTQDWDGTQDGQPVKPEQPGTYVVRATAGASGSATFTLG